MKVLLVSFLFDAQLGGGAATSARRLSQGLAQRGIEVVVVTTHDAPKPRVMTEGNVRIHAFRPRNIYWVGKNPEQPLGKRVIWQLLDVWNPHVYSYMRELLRRERPDVVHVNKLRGLSPSVWAAAVAEGCRPIIQTCRDYEVVSPEGTLESTVGRLALERHWALRPYQVMRSRWSNEVDVVTAPSRFTLDTITSLGFFSQSRQVVVPNTHGLNDDELTGRTAARIDKSPAADDNISLLYLGRLEPEKGINVLCQAFANVADELPRVRLDIAGSGSLGEDLRARYRDIPQIRFHGHMSGPEKDRLIDDALLLLMPSTWREVFGNSIIEGYSYGKPVLAARSGGMPELVREGETGFLVDPGSVEDLQQVIRHVAGTPETIREMAPACRAAARAYTIEAVTNAYLQAYEMGRESVVRRDNGRGESIR
jgi:glycosyltransferase involved in cell wall biosynthesis